MSISASVGHLVVEEDTSVQEKTFLKVLFTNFWLYMVAGVLLGTIISSLCTRVWIEPYVLYKYGFEKSLKMLYVQYVKYFIIFIGAMSITFGINTLIQEESIIFFIIKSGISLVAPNLILFVLYRNKEEFRYLKDVISKKLQRR